MLVSNVFDLGHHSIPDIYPVNNIASAIKTKTVADATGDAEIPEEDRTVEPKSLVARRFQGGMGRDSVR